MWQLERPVVNIGITNSVSDIETNSSGNSAVLSFGA